MECFTDYKAIGKNVRAARRSRGWTQAQLAEAVGCTTQNMTNIENAKTKLSLNMLVRIVEVLGISADQIIDTTPESSADSSPSTESQLREIWNKLSYSDARLCQQACLEFCKGFSRYFPKAKRQKEK